METSEVSRTTSSVGGTLRTKRRWRLFPDREEDVVQRRRDLVVEDLAGEAGVEGKPQLHQRDGDVLCATQSGERSGRHEAMMSTAALVCSASTPRPRCPPRGLTVEAVQDER